MADQRRRKPADQKKIGERSVNSDVLRRLVHGAVSNALSGLKSDQEIESNDDEQDDLKDFQVPPKPRRKGKDKARFLPTPSVFLKDKGKSTKSKSGKDFVYDRDIICLPKTYASSSKVVKVPRGKSTREYLARNGLIGKIRLQSSMSEEDIMNEIRSVFSGPMLADDGFVFDILQSSGGGSKSLTAPSTSTSFKWTAQAVAGVAKSPIYVLAVDDLRLVDESDGSESECDEPDPKKSKEDEDLPTFLHLVEKSKVSPTILVDTPPHIYSGPSTSAGYSSYINLTSDSDEEWKYSPTPPPMSPFTPLQEDDETPDVLLQSHKLKVLPLEMDGPTTRIVVRRKHIWTDSLHAFKNGLDFDKHIKVTFIGEPAVDQGGPLREFLHLLMGSIGRNNNLFCGEATSRSLRHNIPELMNKTFFHVGEMIAVSLVHGGPSPEFLCEAVANYIVSGVMDMKATICSVPNVDIQEKLKKLDEAPTTGDFRSLLSSDEYSFRFDCGVAQPAQNMTIKDKDRVISAIVIHYALSVCKAEIDQLLNGLETLKVLELIRSRPGSMKKLFIHSMTNLLTADEVYSLFQPKLSPEGSNRREFEEQAIMYWLQYLQTIERKAGVLELTDSNGQSMTYNITLSDILAFSTGAPAKPPIGFLPQPSIQFQMDLDFPRANTCSNMLYLPISPVSREEFFYAMTYGILNTAGFGRL